MQAGAANLSAELFCKNYEGQDKGIQHRNHVFLHFFSVDSPSILFQLFLCQWKVLGRCVDSFGIIQMLIPGILRQNNVNYFDND